MFGSESSATADVGPTTYVLSVDTAHNTATLGKNMLGNHSHAYAVMGGYPADPSDPSTARDDTARPTSPPPTPTASSAPTGWPPDAP